MHLKLIRDILAHMSGDAERSESSPRLPLTEAYFKARELFIKPHLDNSVSAHVKFNGEDFETTLTLKWGNEIKAECVRGRISGRISMGGKDRIAFDLSEKYGLEGLVFFGSHLTILDRTIDTGTQIGIGTSELSMNPVPPEKRKEYAQMVTPFVEWLEKFVKTGEMTLPLEIRP